MDFENGIMTDISKKEENKMLLKGGIVLDILGGILFLFGLLALIAGVGAPSLVIIAGAIILIFLGIKNLFLTGEKRERLLTSKKLAMVIKQEKKKGNLTAEDIDKIRFKYDPIFHDNVVAKVHKEQDAAYNNNVRRAEQNVKNLFAAKNKEITRLTNERWNNVGKGMLKYNMTEGKLQFNQHEYLFSNIKGAEVNKEFSYRVVTTQTGKSKKHVSVGKAVVGGALLGPIGAVAGSTMGKTTYSGQSVSNSIPTCNHIGVMIDVDGFKSEIVLLNRTVDQSSAECNNMLRCAEEIVSKLQFLSSQPVPETFKKVEEEESVLRIDDQIQEAQENLEQAKQDKPKYDIPARYIG